MRKRKKGTVLISPLPWNILHLHPIYCNGKGSFGPSKPVLFHTALCIVSLSCEFIFLYNKHVSFLISFAGSKSVLLFVKVHFKYYLLNLQGFFYLLHSCFRNHCVLYLNLLLVGFVMYHIWQHFQIQKESPCPNSLSLSPTPA